MRYNFKEGFLWGAATSGIQTEGGTNQANQSVWDLWYEKNPENFLLGIGPNKVCQTYEKYEEDVQLASEIKLNSLRTSIQWSRLIKDFKTGEVCDDAVSFYNGYIDEMIAKNVEPIINLYHFDMPRTLQEDFGGFESKEVVDMYVLYAKKCFELFGDRVKYWTTFNEPIVPVEGGYIYGFHYPAKNDFKLGIQVGFNTMLAHAGAVVAYREMQLDGEIGVILNLTPSYPKTQSKEDLEAAHIADLFFNRSFLDPMVLGKFPEELTSLLTKYDLLPSYSQEDLEIIKSNLVDFLGVNYYVPRRVQAKEVSEDLKIIDKPEDLFDYYINPQGRFNPYRDNNEIWPVAVYDIAKNIEENYGNIKWYLAEIGIAMDLKSEGEPVDGIIDDSFRTELLKEHFIQLHKAIEEGSNCFGIHMWTFIDCWSWLNSFNRRYGFYRLDLETGDRQIKSNGLWIKKVIEENGFEN